MLRRPGLVGLLYTVPAVALVVAVLYFSVIYTMRLSLLDWDGISERPREVGLDNYRRLLADEYFWTALAHMAVYLVSVPVQMALGMAFAALLRTRVRMKSVYKVLVFLPVVLSPAVMAPVFRQILDANGDLNRILSGLGLGGLARSWLADPDLALYALVGINVWQWTGFAFLLYHAALTQIPAEVLEAARLDGVGAFGVVRHFYLPLTRGTSLTLVILGIIGTVKTFDIPFLVTGGGPARSTEFLGTYIYQQGITNFHAGYGAALTVVLVMISVLLAVPQVRRYRRQGGDL